MIGSANGPDAFEGIAALIGTLFVLALVTSPVWLPVLCGIIGTLTERRHFRSIHARERNTAAVPVIPSPLSDDSRAVASAQLVCGTMVVAPDSLRRFIAGVRKIFGGRLRSYESLLDRARREAILRMKEQAPQADAIVNFRMETTKIGGMQQKQSIIAIEVLAFGTALTYAPPASGSHPSTT